MTAHKHTQTTHTVKACVVTRFIYLSLCGDVRLKVEQPQDVVTGNPTIIKMLVNFYRNARGQNTLRESLGPALQDVLLDRTLSIRTDPVEVYKTWINQTETKTGHKRWQQTHRFTWSSVDLLFWVPHLTHLSLFLQLSAIRGFTC